MRTIKFRGKLKSNGNWEYGDLLHDDIGGCYIYPIDAENLYKDYEVIPETVGQFIGLKDKNGEEIFEGDILDFSGIITEVRFVQGVFVFLVNGNLDERLCDRTDLFAKIIGNIHENPDILKENERLNKISNKTVGFIILILYTIAITVFKIMQ